MLSPRWEPLSSKVGETARKPEASIRGRNVQKGHQTAQYIDHLRVPLPKPKFGLLLLKAIFVVCI